MTLMLRNLDTASVGQPITRLGVSFFPVYLQGNGLPDIATGESPGVEVEELESESVPSLQVTNSGRKPFLLIEGEHFFGGLQNRALNTTVLVPPKTKLEVPVTCTEQGRWRASYRRREDGSHETVRQMRTKRWVAPASLRGNIHRSVNEARRQGATHASSDQGEAWGEVDELRARAGAAPSATSAAADYEEDIYRRHKSRRDAVRELEDIGPLPGQQGFVVTHGRTVKAVELFGKPDLLEAHWGGLVRSCLVEPPEFVDTPSVSKALWGVRRLSWMKLMTNPGVGLGEDVHARDKFMSGHALLWNDALVHATMQFSR